MSAVLDLPFEAPAEAEPFVPGVFTDMPHERYLSLDALSASGIKRILQSPMHYKYDREHPTEATESMLLGTALHMAVLEPDRYADSVIVIPEDAPARPTSRQWTAAKPSPASLAAMQWWTEFETRAAGKLLLKPEQAAKVEGMAGAVRRHPVHDELLRDGTPETSFLWRDARLDIACKARFDYLRDDGIALDLKSCVDASPDGFMRSVAQFKYHYQEAHYRNGHEHLRNESLRAFVFIAVENTAPYGCAVYVIEPNAIMFALDRVEEASILYAHCQKTGYWRGYSERILPIALPRWATTLTVPGGR